MSTGGQGPAPGGPFRVSYGTVIVILKINNKHHKKYFILTLMDFKQGSDC